MTKTTQAEAIEKCAAGNCIKRTCSCNNCVHELERRETEFQELLDRNDERIDTIDAQAKEIEALKAECNRSRIQEMRDLIDSLGGCSGCLEISPMYCNCEIAEDE